MKKNRLAYIRGLMGVSLVLLIALIGSWLNSQYKEQKQQLQKELQAELVIAQKEVSDSVMFNRIIKPNMHTTHISKKSSDFDLPELKRNALLEMVITDDKDTTKPKKVKQQIHISHSINLHGESLNIQKIVTSKNKPTNFIVKDQKVAQEFLKQGLDLVLEELYKQSGISEDSLFILDTTHLRKTFAKKLSAKNWHFATAWGEDAKGGNTNNTIFISTTYLSRDYNIAVNGYNGVIYKKILPQSLFSLLLLLFVAAAFTITFRSLKEQIRLGVIKNDFISNMSHELKTPISTVKVALEALTTFNAIENPQTTQEYLKMASLEMNRLDMLVNQALNTALMEEGKIVIQKECIDLKKMAEDISQMLQLRLKQNDATLSIHTSGNDLTTKADPLHIQGIVINLIDNSLKYSNGHAAIQINIETEANKLKIAVVDNGPGIPAEYLPKVFDKFFRVPSGDRHNVKGYGLGLSYAKQIAMRHDGDITVKNGTEAGCIFTITLPKIPC